MSPIQAYYWLTPIFWIVDEYLGANLRTAALDGHPGWKTAYYILCICIAVIVSVFPERAARVGLFEAGLNIVLLVAGIFVPYYAFIDEMAAGNIPTEPPITMDKMINFILASTVCVIALKVGKTR